MRVLCRRTTPDDFGRNRWADISIHVLRVEDDLCVRATSVMFPRFQSTSSVWRTTLTICGTIWQRANFNPRPPCGGRRVFYIKSTDASDFNPRPPCGGRQEIYRQAPAATIFQSTSSMWRTTRHAQDAGAHVLISIHVLRVEDDVGCRLPGIAPCVFQSTSSVWRTTQCPRSRPRRCDFNPRPPCGGRLPFRVSAFWVFSISIHVLRVEDDGGL